LLYAIEALDYITPNLSKAGQAFFHCSEESNRTWTEAAVHADDLFFFIKSTASEV